MPTKVDFSKDYWRYLYQPLYVAVRDFALQCGDSEEQIALRFARLVTADPSLGLLVEMADLKVDSFCLYTLGTTPAGLVAFVEYIQTRPRKDNTFAQECLDYLESLPIQRIGLATSRSDYRAIERKYGFSTVKVLLEKEVKPKQEEPSYGE